MEHLRGEMGEQAWQDNLSPEVPADEPIPNPYTYTYPTA